MTKNEMTAMLIRSIAEWNTWKQENWDNPIDLSGANLRSADLSGAYLSGADLRSANGVNPLLCSPMHLLRYQVGSIRLFKLVTADGWSPTQSLGRIQYQIGGSVSVNDANTDAYEVCAAGINVASLDWVMREWQSGQRIFVVEFGAEDIACIPTATDGKVRLHRCTVVDEIDPASIGLPLGSAVPAAS